MNNEEKDSKRTEIKDSNDRLTTSNSDERQEEALDKLQDDIIRNDAIPETSKDTPGSNGAFPVGAFDTSKD